MTRDQLIQSLRSFADRLEIHRSEEVWWRLDLEDGEVQIYSEAHSDEIKIEYVLNEMLQDIER